MKKIMFLVLGLGLILTGCNKDNDLFPGAESNEMLKSAKVKMIPIKGSVQSHVTEYQNKVPIIGTLSGKLSHMGKLITEKSIWTTTFMDFDETTWTITWEMTGTACAANGDLLNYDLTGTFSIPENKLDAHIDFDGGSGRFENAEGYMDVTGYADDPTAITTIYMKGEGLISNVGSGK